MQHILDVQPGSTVMELGPGSGGALRAILNHGAKKVYAVEISEVFRNEYVAAVLTSSNRALRLCVAARELLWST